MTTLLRERLTKALKSALKETQERSKDMIQDNIEAGLMHTESPVAGTFDERELTDMKNLINKGDNANTTERGTECGCDHCEEELGCHGEEYGDNIESIVRELVNISEPEFDHHHEDEEFKAKMFGESAFAKMALRILKESDYAGPLDFVPDTRLNVADVVNALKAKIGEGSEGIHVDLDYDEEGNKLYKVSQVDEKKLPKELEVVNVQLKLGDNGYVVEKTREDFPIKKD